ncbi:MAG: hypothetical protein ABI193_24105 [Minicystis sp.]
MSLRLLAPPALALTLLACAKTDEPPPGAVPPSRSAESTKAPARPTLPTPGPAADITWDAPAAWQKAEKPNPMRKATYKVPRSAGDTEDGELAISTAGGSVELNITRWKGQFDKAHDPVINKRTIGDLKVTEVEIEGTFNGGGMPGGPPAEAKPNFAMLAAIVETASGLFFFKLTGPQKTLRAAKPDFDKLLDTLRLK